MKDNRIKSDKIKQTRFSHTLFFSLLGILLAMSALHMGLITLMDIFQVNVVMQSIIPIVYWTLAAFGITFFIQKIVKKTYEEPIKKVAEATSKVAQGDFSIYIHPLHLSNKYDYLDGLILDFNVMVEELGSIETLKTDFFSNVSHEIKTPIAIIQNSAQLLKKGNLDESEQQQYLDSIIITSKKLSELITNLLKLNKLDKQSILPAPRVYNLCKQLVDSVLAFELAWEEKDLEFEVEIEDSAYVCADPSLMELVWNNLISNAIKFTDSGGTVFLQQTQTQDQVIITIKDTGSGMDENTLQHIFDKFYQGDTSHATEGNGLGLALVLRILQLNNSDITVTSELGQGSEFVVSIPLHKEGNEYE